MKTGDWVTFLIMGIVFTAIFTWIWTSFVLFPEGAKTSRLYYEATGEFPNKDWLDNNQFRGYDCPQEIIDNLKPF